MSAAADPYAEPYGDPYAEPYGEPQCGDAEEPEREEEVLPPWAPKPKPCGEVPSLQVIVCGVLAKHLHLMDSLEYLPEHLAAEVRAAIQRDRRLLRDDGLGVWLEAVFAGGAARSLNLRWAASLSCEGLRLLASGHAHYCTALLSLDLGFCELVGDAGVAALAPELPSCRALVLTGCTRCGDASLQAVGRWLGALERLELELCARVTDVGVQAVVRGCTGLSDLRVGGCVKLSCISTSMIADHCKGRMRRLGLGGIAQLCDVDLEDIGRMLALQHLELCACTKVSDAGIKHIGMLAAKQVKAFDAWEAAGRPGGDDAAPPTLRHLDLGGLGRLSDGALQKLTLRTRHLRSIDLRGCARLSEDGLATALAGCTAAGVQASATLCMPHLAAISLRSCGAASERVVTLIRGARPSAELAT